MIIGLVHPGTYFGIFLMRIGSLKTVPPRWFLIVPFGDFHIYFKLNSLTLASSAVIVAHLMPTLYNLHAFAASMVTSSFVKSLFSMLKSKYLISISRNGRISYYEFKLI